MKMATGVQQKTHDSPKHALCVCVFRCNVLVGRMFSVCCEYDLHHPFFVLSDRFMIEIRSDDIDVLCYGMFF